MKQRTFAPLIGVLTVVLLVACGGDSGDPDPTATATAVPDAMSISAGEPLVIGVSAVLSGGQATIGQDLVDAVTLAVEEFGRPIAGHELRVETADDGCNDPEAAVAASATLIGRDAVAIIGPMCTTGAQAANDEYEDAGIVHITPSATRADLSELDARFFFRTAWRDDDQARIQAMYARESLRAATAVVIDDGEPYGTALADEFITQFEARGGRVSSRERIMRGETSFEPLAGLIASTNPDVVVFQGPDPEGSLLLRDLRAASYGGTFIGPDSLFNAEDLIQGAGEAAEGAVITAGPVPDATFNERFTARFGRAPSTSFVLQTYDAARVLLTAIDASFGAADGDTSLSRTALLDYLRGNTFTGLTGNMTFSDSGDRTGDTARDVGLAIYRVTDGVFQQVE